ncbi:MAG: hypothetical protein OXS29_13490 [bacterium]|nr:hypothetical protein [bacterium]MDE0289539.1 hypothetical protein [bacterium]MDE0437695.1 hypothetical protein [bacterium]
MHPAIRAACRTLAQAGIGFTVLATPPWEEPEASQSSDRVAAKTRQVPRHGDAHQLDFGFSRAAYSYKTPGQRSEHRREYA